MWDARAAPGNRHIFSEQMDIIAFTMPIVLSFAAAPFLYRWVSPHSIPLLGYIVIVVLTDVAHVWSTLFRTHFDTTENRRRWFLYNVVPVLIFLTQIAIHYVLGEATFWTAMGYFAIYHFVKQQYGFLMVAKARAKDFANMARDKYLLYLLAGLPILLWHSDDTRYFDWFNRDDPFVIASFPHVMSSPLLFGALRPVSLLYVVYAAVWLYFAFSMAKDYLQCDARGAAFPTMKALMLLYSGISWGMGVLFNHKLIALTFLNLFHAVPSFLIVFCCARNRWHIVGSSAAGAGGGLAAPADDAANNTSSMANLVGQFLTRHKSRLWGYLAFLMVLGVVEEVLWESIIWQDYTSSWFLWNPDTDFPHPILHSATVSLLILPQSTHYFLDMYIWKMGKNADGSEMNPHLKKYLALSQ